MEKEEGKTQRVTTAFTGVFQTNFQWGSRKRPRCVKVKEEDTSVRSDGGCGGGGGGGSSGGIRKKITSRIIRAEKETPISLSPNRLVNKNSSDSAAILRSNGVTENWKSQSCSPEKGEDRYYTTRGSLLGFEDNGKIFMETGVTEDRGFVWPKLFISLSSKEKEEDFMAMKGCKLPQRPKKRAKFIQRSLLLVSPGAWLSDLCQERYEVREKKTSKKRPRGLKAMGSMESDSE